MAMKETIKTGRKYRKCIDNTSGNKKWERYSFWSKASDVEFNDGTTAENKLGGFKGVTTNENQVAGYAADVTLVKSIKTSLSNLITSLSNLVDSINTRLGGMRFYEDSTGKYVVGADSVPKKLGSISEGDVLNYFEYCTRGRQVFENDPSYGWLNITEFDLSKYDGYQDFKFGDNIIAFVSRVLVTQKTAYDVGILLANQKNDNFITYNNVDNGWYDWPARPLKGGYLRYNPTIGKLLCLNFFTCQTEGITLIKL